MPPSIGALAAVSLGALCYAGAAFGVYNYVQLTAMPLREPSDVTAGEDAALRVELTEGSPTVRAPFSGAAVPIAYWRIRRRDVGEDGGSIPVAEDLWHADRLEATADGYEITVHLPDELSSWDLREQPDFETVAEVDPDTDPPERIAAFEDAADLSDGVSLTGHRRTRWYLEDRYEPGDTVTVYGRVSPTSGDVVSGGEFEVTAADTDFRIMREAPSGTKRKRLLAAAAMAVLGTVFLAVGGTLL